MSDNCKLYHNLAAFAAINQRLQSLVLSLARTSSFRPTVSAPMGMKLFKHMNLCNIRENWLVVINSVALRRVISSNDSE